MADVSIAIIDATTLAETLGIDLDLWPHVTETLTVAEVLALAAPLLVTPGVDSVVLGEPFWELNIGPTGERITEAFGSRHVRLLDTTLTTAVSQNKSAIVPSVSRINSLVVLARFHYGSGGTTATFWVQTSLNGGQTWVDIMCFAFTTAGATKVSAVHMHTALAAAVTPTDGALADNTIVNGLLGGYLR